MPHALNRPFKRAYNPMRTSNADMGDIMNDQVTLEEYAQTIDFPVGDPNDAYAQYFSGRSWLAPVSSDQVFIANVTFEPGCRNSWHVHDAEEGGGQILICTGGRGYCRFWGEDAVEMRPGDVVNIPTGVKHWHGAAPDSWFSHLAIEVPGVGTGSEWLEVVSDEEYASATA